MPAVADQPIASRGEVVLAVAGLAKAFGQTQTLRDCSFDVRAGEVHAVVGENGSGKSTLVKLLSGVIRQSAGTIRIDGRPIGREGPAEIQRLGLSTVFQEVLLAPDRSVVHQRWLQLVKEDTLVIVVKATELQEKKEEPPAPGGR